MSGWCYSADEAVYKLNCPNLSQLSPVDILMADHLFLSEGRKAVFCYHFAARVFLYSPFRLPNQVTYYREGWY